LDDGAFFLVEVLSHPLLDLIESERIDFLAIPFPFRLREVLFLDFKSETISSFFLVPDGRRTDLFSFEAIGDPPARQGFCQFFFSFFFPGETSGNPSPVKTLLTISAFEGEPRFSREGGKQQGRLFSGSKRMTVPASFSFFPSYLRR